MDKIVSLILVLMLAGLVCAQSELPAKEVCPGDKIELPCLLDYGADGTVYDAQATSSRVTIERPYDFGGGYLMQDAPMTKIAPGRFQIRPAADFFPAANRVYLATQNCSSPVSPQGWYSGDVNIVVKQSSDCGTGDGTPSQAGSVSDGGTVPGSLGVTDTFVSFLQNNLGMGKSEAQAQASGVGAGLSGLLSGAGSALSALGTITRAGADAVTSPAKTVGNLISGSWSMLWEIIKRFFVVLLVLELIYVLMKMSQVGFFQLILDWVRDHARVASFGFDFLKTAAGGILVVVQAFAALIGAVVPVLTSPVGAAATVIGGTVAGTAAVARSIFGESFTSFFYSPGLMLGDFLRRKTQ